MSSSTPLDRLGSRIDTDPCSGSIVGGVGTSGSIIDGVGTAEGSMKPAGSTASNGWRKGAGTGISVAGEATGLSGGNAAGD